MTALIRESGFLFHQLMRVRHLAVTREDNWNRVIYFSALGKDKDKAELCIISTAWVWFSVRARLTAGRRPTPIRRDLGWFLRNSKVSPSYGLAASFTVSYEQQLAALQPPARPCEASSAGQCSCLPRLLLDLTLLAPPGQQQPAAHALPSRGSLGPSGLRVHPQQQPSSRSPKKPGPPAAAPSG